MKRLVLALLAIFALTTAGVLVAQTSTTTAPGPTQQREPGQTSNNLPNPGNPQTNLQRPTGTTGTGVAPETEQGEGMDLDVDTGARAEDGLVDVEVNQTHDADTSARGNDQGTTTGTTGTMTGTTTATGTGLANETETGTGVDVDVDTGDRAAGAVDVDVDSTTDADTSASGVDETGGMGDDANAAYGDQDTLPSTASGLPLLFLIGLMSLGAAYTVRTLAKRDI